MKHLHNKRVQGAIACALAAGGVVFGSWIIALFGVVLAIVLGRWVTAVLLGLILDVVYGTPTGALHVVWLPVTLFAVAGVALRMLVLGRIRTIHRDTL